MSATPVRYNFRYALVISAVSALGGLLFGYDWVVIGGAKPFFERYFELNSEALVGWANSCALLGCLAGSMMAGPLCDRFGRKRAMIVSALLFGISSIFTGWSPAFTWFIVWRMTGGIAIGLASAVSPMYIAEVSPASLRGRLVALNQLTIVVGILASQIVNWLIARPIPIGATAEMVRLSWNGQYAWRWMFTAVAVPSAVFLLCALFVPESPRWQIKKGALADARRTLVRIGGEAYAGKVVGEVRGSLDSEGVAKAPLPILFSSRFLPLLLVAIGLAVLQQWSGINVIFNYAEEIYRSAGYGVGDVLFNIMITGTINLIFTLLAMAMVDRFGRRFLMLLGCAGIGVSHVLLGFAYRLNLKGLPVLILTLSAIACYALTLAPVVWVLISEIFPNRIRAAGLSAAVSALWIACFALTFTFPILNRALGPSGTFWLYGGICFAGLVFVQRCVPETAGLSLEEIERQVSA
jgi:SP family xylose:H+ symportor-like MFS transporter